MLRRLVFVAFALLIGTSACSAGPVLDDILNYMFLDQGTALKPPEETWVMDGVFSLMKDEPAGQTFVTGPNTDKIVRIRTCVAPNPDWQPGEGAELVLWDSPAKKVSYGRYTIFYPFRGYHYDQSEFEVDARVLPNTSYYFEVSYVGTGDGKLGKIGMVKGDNIYKSGQAYVAGKEVPFGLCFQIHSKSPLDRIGNLKKTFARFDLSRPELSEIKAAVGKEDFDTAVAKTVAYFESRKGPTSIIDPRDVPAFRPDFDTTGGDLAMQNYFKSSDGGEGYAGPDLNWRAEVSFDEEGRKIAGDFDLNRFGARGVVTAAYLSTGNEKYAKKFNDMMIDWFLDNPPPPYSHIGGVAWDQVWASLQTGIRLGQSFVAYSRAHTSPFFTTDCRFAWIVDMADHADTLVAVGANAGGNWAFTQNGSMMDFALNFPEYTNSKIWFDTAAERITKSIRKDYMPDGVEMEAAPGYQRFAYKPLANMMETLQERKVQAPFLTGLKNLLEKEAEYFMYLGMPNGNTPFLGDWGDDNSALLADSKRYDRPDMLYVVSKGKQGKKPKELSKLYPYTGIVTFRSDWGDVGRPYEDSRYMMLHGLHWGAHGHADINGVTAYAYGRELLADPGSYIYSSPEHAFLNKAQSHNLMTIDGQDQRRNSDTRFDNWSTTPVADYLSSFADAYKAGGHNREVFYIRGNRTPAAKDYWIVRDTALGEGTHSLAQQWHFSYESKVLADKGSLTAATTFPTGGNLAIKQIDPASLSLEESTAKTWYPRGKTSQPKLMPLMIYKKQATLPAAIDTALFPFEGRLATPQVKTIAKSKDGMDSAFKVVQGKIEDLFVFQQTAQKKSFPAEKVSFDGLRLFVRRVGGKVRSVLLVNGGNLTIGGKQIIKSAKPLMSVAVDFSPNGTNVYTSSTEPTLRVASVGKLTIKSRNIVKILNPVDAKTYDPLGGK